MEYHVTPIGDLIEHEQDEDCPCGPDVEFIDGGSSVYVHHALDEREQESVEERGAG